MKACAFTVLLWFATMATNAAELELVGKSAKASPYLIHVADEAPSSVKLAAEELQRTIQIATGVRLNISNTASETMICVGNNTASNQAKLATGDLANDGFRIVTVGQSIYILGKDTPDNYQWLGWDSRGTLFGAYAFLEDVVGARWLMPGEWGEEIPKRDGLSVPVQDVRQEPAFEARELVDVQNQIRSPHPDDHGPALVDRWLLRNKLANVSYGLKKYRFKIWHTHAWSRYIKPKDMHENPDFRAVSGGKDKFCTTNEKLVALFAQRVIEWLDANPTYRSAPISPEDGGNFCKCNTCASHTEKDWHGRFSCTPLILKFYNDVARIVARKHPDRVLGGYIYYNYMYPPKQPMKMEPNVHLALAPLNYYGWGLAKPAYRAELPKLIQGWTDLTPNFSYQNWSVWLRSLNGMPLPPGLPILEWELPTLKRHGAKGVSMVGIGAWGYGGCENYLLARLLWDTNTDVRATYREWMQLAYGPAWKTMDRFTMMIEERLLARKRKESLVYGGDNYEVTIELVKDVYQPIVPELLALYEQALTEVVTDKQRKRLEMLGDNLVMLHYNMRNAKLLDDKTVANKRFYRSGPEYDRFIADTVFSLALYRDHGHRDLPPLYSGSFSGAAENPAMEERSLNISRVDDGAAPLIDGDLDDLAWETGGLAEAFRLVGGLKPASQQTFVRLLYDDENLYLAFDCKESKADKIAHLIKGEDDAVFGDDCVEIFIACFPNARSDYWHLAVGAANGRWDGVGRSSHRDLSWRSATSIDNDGWRAEVAIPLAELGIRDPKGKSFAANLSRGEQPHGEYSSWSAVYRSFNERYSFGQWTFAE